MSQAVIAAVHLFNQIGYFSLVVTLKLDDHAFQDIRGWLCHAECADELTISISGNLNFDLAKLRINLAIIDAVFGIAGVPAAFVRGIVAYNSSSSKSLTACWISVRNKSLILS